MFRKISFIENWSFIYFVISNEYLMSHTKCSCFRDFVDENAVTKLYCNSHITIVNANYESIKAQSHWTKAKAKATPPSDDLLGNSICYVHGVGAKIKRNFRPRSMQINPCGSFTLRPRPIKVPITCIQNPMEISITCISFCLWAVWTHPQFYTTNFYRSPSLFPSPTM